MAYRILVSCNTIDPAVNYLKQRGYEIKRQTSYDYDSTVRDLQDCDAFLMDEGICDAAMLKHAPALKVIGKESVGLDAIDLEAAQALGIWVTNARGANARSVAEHTMALILACSKNLLQMDQMTRGGKWPRRELPTIDLYQKTLGIIGLGAIGRLTAQMAHDGFGMNIIAYDTHASDELRRTYNIKDSLNELLTQSDYITLHVPLTHDTYHMIGADQLNAMKSTAFLINCARGDVVDPGALYCSLKDKKIAGAGLDALSQEPLDPSNPLAALENVIFSPHNAAFTEETIVRMWMYAAQGIDEVLSGKIPSRPGNCPQRPRMNGEMLA